MRRATRWMFGATLLVAAAVTPVFAGKHNKTLDVGDAAPQFSGLQGVDGKTYSLADFEKKDVIVVVFTCNGCPVAQAYNERFNEFVAEYKDKPVGFVAINVNATPKESVDAMKEFAKEHDLKYVYAADETQKSGKAYGAAVTPHVFVLDKERKIAYMGAWDDSPMNADKVEKTFTRDAVEALLAGKAPKVTETQQVGCGIRYQ
jgi:peroxiredoxin